MEDQKYQNLRTEFFKLARNRKGYNISIMLAYKWLELEYSSIAKENLLKRYLRQENYRFVEVDDEDKLGDFLIKKDGRKQIIYFSNKGFKKLCLSLNSVKSGYVMDHFIQCEEDYLDSLERSEEENKKKAAELKEREANFESTIEKLHKAIDERDEFEIKAQMYQQENLKYRYVDDLLKEDDFSYFAVDCSPRAALLNWYIEKYGHDAPLYIVDPEYVNKDTKKAKKSTKKESGDEFDEFDEYDIKSDPEVHEEIEKLYPDTPLDDVSELSLRFEHEEEPFYFYMPSTRMKTPREHYKYVGTIKVVDKQHIVYIRSHFLANKESKTKYKTVFSATYANIVSVMNDYIAKGLFKRLKNDKKC